MASRLQVILIYSAASSAVGSRAGILVCAILRAVLFAFRPPTINARGPQYAEHALAAIHASQTSRQQFSLIVGSTGGTAGLFLRLTDRLQPLVSGQLLAHYPDAAIVSIDDDAFTSPPDRVVIVRRLYLTPSLFPIRRYAQFADDQNRTLVEPLQALLAAVHTRADSPFTLRAELTLAPARPSQLARARHVLRNLATPIFASHPSMAGLYARSVLGPSRRLSLAAMLLVRLVRGHASVTGHDPTSVTGSKNHDRENDLQAAADKLGRHCFSCWLTLIAITSPEHRLAAQQRLDRLVGAFGQFSVPRLASFQVARRRRLPGFLLSTEEVASLFHLPVSDTPVASLASHARQFEPPPLLPSPTSERDVTTIGETFYRDRCDVFGIKTRDLQRHLFLAGRTGMGKTTLLERLILADITAGKALIYVDPHGDSYDRLLHHLPKARTNDIVLFDPADRSHPLAFNLLECSDPARRSLVASGVVASFRKTYSDSWGPRLEYLLSQAALALLCVPGTTLLHLVRFLTDFRYRTSVLGYIDDPALRGYWQDEFGALPARLRSEWISPVLNKVGALTASPILRNIVGQPRSTLDLRRAIDTSKVVLCRFSKGSLGDDASRLLGSLFLTAVQLAVLSRSDVAEQDRSPVGIYVDEFHSFATTGFATLFSEARKYSAHLVAATQFMDQLDEATLAAVVGNVGNIISFGVGASDSERLAEILGSPLTPQDLRDLPQYIAVARILVDGHPTTPFTIRSLPLHKPNGPVQSADVLRRTSRHHYARPLIEVERQLASMIR